MTQQRVKRPRPKRTVVPHASMGGRPRKPTALKRADGSFRPDRANLDEPRAAAIDIPAPPDRLSPTERAVWVELAPVVDSMRVVSEADLACFEALVLSLALVRDCRTAVRQHGLTYLTKAGAIVARPEVQLIATHLKLAVVFLSRFGLTPADRSRVAALGGETMDGALAEFLE